MSHTTEQIGALLLGSGSMENKSLVSLWPCCNAGKVKRTQNLSAIVEDASPEVLESMEDAANIHDEEC